MPEKQLVNLKYFLKDWFYSQDVQGCNKFDAKYTFGIPLKHYTWLSRTGTVFDTNTSINPNILSYKIQDTLTRYFGKCEIEIWQDIGSSYYEDHKLEVTMKLDDIGIKSAQILYGNIQDLDMLFELEESDFELVNAA